MTLVSGAGDGSSPRDPAAVRIRLVAAGAALLTVGAGLGLRAVAAGGVAEYGGDTLYTVLLLALLVLVAPRWTPLRAAGTALALSWAVELFQLSSVPAELSRHSVAARLVLGSTFNAPDLFWYAVGAVGGGLLHTAMSRRRRTPVAGGRTPVAGDTPHT
ncbi:DUF2809 domain-containing protein [Streptomyces sp. NPDC060232]|uniref:ribosomal maturation YjgA family protein n=1 Tax=Streptomyces sp. NPDC060232 TaxID=3347079 RepID=UPI00366027FB